LEEENKEGKAMYIPLMLRDSADDIKQQGMKEGMEKGMEKVAQRMLARNMSVSEIVDITGLSEQDILSL
jgi:predicted transposase/invertase (TIGR01784 family)